VWLALIKPMKQFHCIKMEPSDKGTFLKNIEKTNYINECNHENLDLFKLIKFYWSHNSLKNALGMLSS